MVRASCYQHNHENSSLGGAFAAKYINANSPNSLRGKNQFSLRQCKHRSRWVFNICGPSVVLFEHFLSYHFPDKFCAIFAKNITSRLLFVHALTEISPLWTEKLCWKFLINFDFTKVLWWDWKRKSYFFLFWYEVMVQSFWSIIVKKSSLTWRRSILRFILLLHKFYPMLAIGSDCV